MKRSSNPKPIIGWREWVGLPALGIPVVKVKVDTGARSSAIHAEHIEPYRRAGKNFLRFVIHPLQRSGEFATQARAEVLDQREVKSSSGQLETRWVIRTTFRIHDQDWPLDLTLSRRDSMGFRMLLGREAVRNRFLIDPGRSFLAGRLSKLRAISLLESELKRPS